MTLARSDEEPEEGYTSRSQPCSPSSCITSWSTWWAYGDIGPGSRLGSIDSDINSLTLEVHCPVTGSAAEPWHVHGCPPPLQVLTPLGALCTSYCVCVKALSLLLSSLCLGFWDISLCSPSLPWIHGNPPVLVFLNLGIRHICHHTKLFLYKLFIETCFTLIIVYDNNSRFYPTAYELPSHGLLTMVTIPGIKFLLWNRLQNPSRKWLVTW